MQRCPRWTLRFAKMRPREERSPLRSGDLIHARAIRLRSRPAVNVRDLIAQPVPGFPDAEGIIREPHGQPHLAPCGGAARVNLLNRARRRRTVAAAIIRAFKTGSSSFRAFWQRRSDAERRALRTPAHPGTPLGDAFPAMRAALARREARPAADGMHVVQAPMIHRWVIRRQT